MTGVVLVGTGASAPAQEAELPIVDAVDSFGPAGLGYVDCAGVTQTVEYLDGGVLFLRTGEVLDPLAVPVTYSGSLADDLVDPPAEAVFEDGLDFAELYFEFDELADGELTVTAEPGAGHQLGTASITIAVDGQPDVLADCTTNLSTTADGVERQTIDVGQTPRSLGFVVELRDEESDDDVQPVDELEIPRRFARAAAPAATDRGSAVQDPSSRAIVVVDTDGEEVDADIADLFSTPVANGSLPPGLTYVDDVWGGAATTAGTYDFEVRLCVDPDDVDWDDAPLLAAVFLADELGIDVCLGHVDVRIVVENVIVPTTTPPATPVNTTARFTG